MHLSEIVAALQRRDQLVRAPEANPRLSGVSDDSRRIEPGMLYVAVRGTQADGHRYLADAAARGAAAALVEEPQPGDLPQAVVRSGRRAAGIAARTWYDAPADHLTLVGVTGTNGKTTTVSIIRHLLNHQGCAGSIGTLGAYDGAGERVPSTAGSLTTPGPVDLQATLAALRQRGATHVAMETSSHALDQGRLDDLTFAAGVFTNLTHEHLDYHHTLEHYLAAKLRLDALLGLDGVQVVNADDPAWRRLPPRKSRVRFGLTPEADVYPEGLVLTSTGSRFRLVSPWGGAEVRFPLLGDYNVANALGAAAAVLALGEPAGRVSERLGSVPQVPGRMELLADTPCAVLRDYAHTPDGFVRALGALRAVTRGRLMLLFGGGGDRDRTSRPERGRIAVEMTDLVVLTTDNPRTESLDQIMDDIIRGMGGRPYWRIDDRREAIERLLAEAKPEDTILLAGKGHETYQIMGREKIPFDERAIVRNWVDSR